MIPDRKADAPGGNRGDAAGRCDGVHDFNISEPQVSILDDVSRLDAAWFRAHPHAGSYIRRLIPGEMGPYPTGRANWVLVTQLFRGARHRTPLRLYADSDAPLARMIHADTGDRWDVSEDGALTPRPPTTCEPWEVICPSDSRHLIEAGRTVEGDWS